MNPQLSALSVEREDIIKGHAQMLWHDPSLSYCRCFVVPHCFPSFQNYFGLLVVPLFGIDPCSNVGVATCVTLNFVCVCVCVVICVTFMMFWVLLVVQCSCCFA